MTHEERKELHHKFHSGVKMLVDKMEKIGKEKSMWSLEEMHCLADILKDLAKTEKYLAKTHCLYKEHSEEMY